MSRLILQMQMSVDGHMAADTEVDWQVWNWGDHWAWDGRLKRRFNAVFRERFRMSPSEWRRRIPAVAGPQLVHGGVEVGGAIV